MNRTIHVLDSVSDRHQESSTVHTAIGHTGYTDCLPASSQYNLYVLLFVQCWTPDDGQRHCPKHVESYSKNKFEKLALLVGFSTRRWSSIVHSSGEPIPAYQNHSSHITAHYNVKMCPMWRNVPLICKLHKSLWYFENKNQS